MTDITKEIAIATAEAVKEMYQVELIPGDLLITSTKKEHKGDYTLAVSYTHLRAHETVLDLVCRLLLEKKNTKQHHRTHY